MNLLLFAAHELSPHQTLEITDSRRLDHLLKIKRVKERDYLEAGLENGLMGTAQVLQSSQEKITLKVELANPPPTTLPLTLLIGLPRPKMLKRILQSTIALGVKDIYLINSVKVEKSFWLSPLLEPEALHEQMVLGLEQAKDTQFPNIYLKKRFKPFVEDELPSLLKRQSDAAKGNHRALIAHPGGYPPCPADLSGACTLAIGPEGGFIPYEVEKLQDAGFDPVQMGPRILRVETAVPALTHRLFGGAI